MICISVSIKSDYLYISSNNLIITISENIKHAHVVWKFEHYNLFYIEHIQENYIYWWIYYFKKLWFLFQFAFFTISYEISKNLFPPITTTWTLNPDSVFLKAVYFSLKLKTFLSIFSAILYQNEHPCRGLYEQFIRILFHW